MTKVSPTCRRTGSGCDESVTLVSYMPAQSCLLHARSAREAAGELARVRRREEAEAEAARERAEQAEAERIAALRSVRRSCNNGWDVTQGV